MPPSLPRVLLVIIDGLGDVAIAQLQARGQQQLQHYEQAEVGLIGSTPLQSTLTPHLDALASQTDNHVRPCSCRSARCPSTDSPSLCLCAQSEG